MLVIPKGVSSVVLLFPGSWWSCATKTSTGGVVFSRFPKGVSNGYVIRCISWNREAARWSWWQLNSWIHWWTIAEQYYKTYFFHWTVEWYYSDKFMLTNLCLALNCRGPRSFQWLTPPRSFQGKNEEGRWRNNTVPRHLSPRELFRVETSQFNDTVRLFIVTLAIFIICQLYPIVQMINVPKAVDVCCFYPEKLFLLHLALLLSRQPRNSFWTCLKPMA